MWFMDGHLTAQTYVGMTLITPKPLSISLIIWSRLVTADLICRGTKLSEFAHQRMQGVLQGIKYNGLSEADLLIELVK